jgi:hypothetical protein
MFELGPTFIPFTIHWNVGVGAPLAGAPFTGAPVNVTEEPRQNGFDGVDIETLTGRIGLTDTGYWMLDAGLFVVQVSEDNNVQDTRSPLSGVKV